MMDVKQVRAGQMGYVFPEMFPEDGPFTRPIVANMIDVAARDLAEVIAPLPSFNCSSSTSVSDRARQFAEKRTRIAGNYVIYSNTQRQMFTASDRYVSYGFVPAIVEIDWDEYMPRIKWLDCTGVYTLKDKRDKVKVLFQTIWYQVDELIAKFPELAKAIEKYAGPQSTRLEVVRYHDKDWDIMFLPGQSGFELMRTVNPVGVCLAVEVKRPGLGDEARGQFDDVLAVQVAKARFALLGLEAAQKAVQAPIALPQDVQELAMGADSVLRSSQPEKIRRIGLEVPSSTFAEQGLLDQELRQGSRYPEVRGGNTDASIVTGRGVQALMGGFDTQVRTAHAMFAEAFTDLIKLCFLVEDTCWPQVKKTVRGNDNGTPFEISYTPEKDINGDHSVDVQYGLMAGLDPNRALVFGLQARGDRLISQDWLRRQLPFSLNATEEEQKLDVEDLRQTLRQAVNVYAQSIPMLAQNGQDPSEVLGKIALIIEGRLRNKPIEELVVSAFAPPKMPDVGVDNTVEANTPSEAPGMVPPTSGLPQGMPPAPAGAPPDMATLLAGLSSNGNANLSANISRRGPIQ
jgi:hypothetical protein